MKRNLKRKKNNSLASIKKTIVIQCNLYLTSKTGGLKAYSLYGKTLFRIFHVKGWEAQKVGVFQKV